MSFARHFSPASVKLLKSPQRGYQGGMVSYFELIEQQRQLLRSGTHGRRKGAQRERLIGELNLALAGRAADRLRAQRRGRAPMIERLIEYCARNRAVIIAAWIGFALYGVWVMQRTPVDAIPDL
jgi:hypothetical protein